VDKITKNSVDLSWTKPLNDGGAKLTGYVVEKKKKVRVLPFVFGI
jgi:hypothetical protein